MVTVKTPSGQVYQMPPEEEMRIAREAAAQKLRDQLARKHQLQSELLRAAITAIGTAVGVAFATWIATRVRGDEG